MKKTIAIAALIITLFSISCKKFLDVSPLDNVVVENYYNNDAQVKAALTGVYSSFINASYSRYMFADFSSSDEAYTSSGNGGGNGLANNVYLYQFDYTNPVINDFWQKLYTCINNANLLLENIDKANLKKNVRDNYYAQALFLRSFAYYLLVSHYGDVPLRLKSTSNLADISAVRASTDVVYLQIVNDMRFAIDNLPTATTLNTTSRISKTAAQAILARVFLTMAGAKPIGLANSTYYDSVITYTKAVVNSGVHSLNVSKQGVTLPDSSYAQIFINESQQRTDFKECLFEATFSGNLTGAFTLTGFVGYHTGPPFAGTFNDASIGFNFSFVNATATLYRLYGTGDLRRDWCITPYYYTGSASNPAVSSAGIGKRGYDNVLYNRYNGKWRREFETLIPKSRFGSPASFPIIRYSDVLLMLAEAQLLSPNGDKSEALGYVNMVRRRGYGVNIATANAAADLTSLTLKNIMDERARELCFEGVRWTDLRRWGIWKSSMSDLLATMMADGLASRANQFFSLPANNTVNFTLGPLMAQNATSSDKFLLFPIPSSELGTNSLATQNFGW